MENREKDNKNTSQKLDHKKEDYKKDNIKSDRRRGNRRKPNNRRNDDRQAAGHPDTGRQNDHQDRPEDRLENRREELRREASQRAEHRRGSGDKPEQHKHKESGGRPEQSRENGKKVNRRRTSNEKNEKRKKGGEKGKNRRSSEKQVRNITDVQTSDMSQVESTALEAAAAKTETGGQMQTREQAEVSEARQEGLKVRRSEVMPGPIPGGIVAYDQTAETGTGTEAPDQINTGNQTENAINRTAGTGRAAEMTSLQESDYHQAENADRQGASDPLEEPADQQDKPDLEPEAKEYRESQDRIESVDRQESQDRAEPADRIETADRQEAGSQAENTGRAGNSDQQGGSGSPNSSVKVIGVRFRDNGKIYYFSAGKLPVKLGDHVIVETARGIEYGKVVLGDRVVEEKRIISTLKSVLRIATAEDDRIHRDNRIRSREAYGVCLEKIRKHGLDMKLIDCEYTFDNNKVLFYFTADGRIDFRELVKDLAAVFKTRIELRQIGVRDETKIKGGIGSCGRNLCCNTFLAEFIPVSIKMAKEQNLSLNPAKISGVCGRLMCCLKNEQDTYEYLNKKLPNPGDEVRLPEGGKGTVQSVNVLRQKVRVIITDEKDEKELVEYDARDLSFHSRKRKDRGKVDPELRKLETVEKKESRPRRS